MAKPEYTNKYVFALNENMDEFAISFFHDHPNFGHTEANEITSTASIDKICELVMSRKMAHSLMERLCEVLGEEEKVNG